MKVILIRHSMTEGNRLHRYIGKTDEPLSEEGIRLAQKVRQTVALDCATARDAGTGTDCLPDNVYVTPLLRTRQTADIFFPGIKQTVNDDLREMDFGIFENRSPDDMSEDPDYRAWVNGGCLGACPDGESYEDFTDRVCHAFEGIIRSSADTGMPAIFFVVHGGTIMAILERYALPRNNFYEYSIKNCSGYICGINSTDPLVITDIRHLPDPD